MSVVLLLGIILLREPHFAQAEDAFLRWLLDHSEAETRLPGALTVIEIARQSLVDPAAAHATLKASEPPKSASAASALPLEFASFLQSALEYQPGVVAFGNPVRWRDRGKDQEQVFLDQAMRVLKLLLASELSNTAEPGADIRVDRRIPPRCARSDCSFQRLADRPPAPRCALDIDCSGCFSAQKNA